MPGARNRHHPRMLQRAILKTPANATWHFPCSASIILANKPPLEGNRMLLENQIIDSKYKITSICSDAGGMGTVVHVQPVAGSIAFPVVMKYCKATDEESRLRFVREVRYLAGLAKNPHFVEVVDLTHSPPYFVMKYYKDGDLLGLISDLSKNAVKQEQVFNQICDCIAELHLHGYTHRDIKPQNFLRDGSHVVVSDFGLAKAVGLGTTFTMSDRFWGTQGFMPPEFHKGEFKSASPKSDVFMLGKTFYALLTGRDPTYLASDDIYPALFHVIERCCSLKAHDRYDSIASLRQDLTLAFDVILGRADALGKARQKLAAIMGRLESENKYDSKQVCELLDTVAKLEQGERNALLSELDKKMFLVISQEPCESHIGKFLDDYFEYAQAAVSSWSYAEVVADMMQVVFNRSKDSRHKTRALEIAMKCAEKANRFAAMATCRVMVVSTPNDDLGVAVAAMLRKHKFSFLTSVETTSYQSDAIRNAIRSYSP